MTCKLQFLTLKIYFRSNLYKKIIPIISPLFLSRSRVPGQCLCLAEQRKRNVTGPSGTSVKKNSGEWENV